MALSDIEKSFIYEYSARLLERDMLTNQLFAGSAVGRNLRSLVLGQPVRAQTFTNPFEDAISGTLRADAGATRQAARNVGEAASMMGVARTGVSTITGALRDMQEIIDKINSGELDGSSSVVQGDYNALRDKIVGTISGTDFNGISMLDSAKWGTSQIGMDGKVFIQSGPKGGFDISFHAVDTPSSGVAWADLAGADLGAEGTRANQLGYVQALASEMDSVQSMYRSKEDSLHSQELALQSQAQILDNAARLRKPSDPGMTLEKLLAELILKESGTIFDSKG
ncbi:flagellin [Pseudodesulfovibrio sp. F-1]|uniref:Flagellin n=1 Tax=Pseudodesulfovibrio alkaliphilus TaxID=2661613 RepID=A0A7K1KQS5_9BACT|nr:flagellin [Pseudodesulfovibrio alkaliphilus]MUM78449.1 flagellin [Pseudodesulfovibrio alkaliphilus]